MLEKSVFQEWRQNKKYNSYRNSREKLPLFTGEKSFLKVQLNLDENYSINKKVIEKVTGHEIKM